MNYLYHAYAQMQAAIDAGCYGEDQTEHLRSAEVSAAVASAESLKRIAECLETLVEAQTGEAATQTEQPARPKWLPNWIGGNIVRSDDDYVIEHDINWGGNYFLFARTHHPDNKSLCCIGNVHRGNDKRWVATINKPYQSDDDSDAELVTISSDADHCIQALWNERHRAWEGT